MLDVGIRAGAPLGRDDRPPGDRLERHWTDEPGGRSRHDGDDIMPALLQSAADLDRLVGAYPAGDAEGDEGHRTTYSSSTFSTLRLNTSRWAMVTFFSPDSRGSAPRSS